jgi:hypothetical protein
VRTPAVPPILGGLVAPAPGVHAPTRQGPAHPSPSGDPTSGSGLPVPLPAIDLHGAVAAVVVHAAPSGRLEGTLRALGL